MGDQPLQISVPEVLRRLYGRTNADIQNVRAHINTIPGSTRVFSCMTCSESFCTYEQHIGSVFDLKNQQFPNWYHVRQAANTKLVESEEGIFSALLGDEKMIIFNAVRCTSCDNNVGYKVIIVDEGVTELKVGELILIARLSLEIP